MIWFEARLIRAGKKAVSDKLRTTRAGAAHVVALLLVALLRATSAVKAMVAVKIW